jgi:hypothetical protein
VSRPDEEVGTHKSRLQRWEGGSQIADRKFEIGNFRLKGQGNGQEKGAGQDVGGTKGERSRTRRRATRKHPVFADIAKSGPAVNSRHAEWKGSACAGEAAQAEIAARRSVTQTLRDWAKLCRAPTKGRDAEIAATALRGRRI